MEKSIDALRTPQIDAFFLDESFHNFNWEIFSSLFRRHPSSHWVHTFKNEFQLFLRLLTASNTVFSENNPATIGQRILQVKYSTAPMNRFQKYLYLISLFGSYLYEKFVVGSNRFYGVYFLYTSMKLINLLCFLYQGRYLNIFERFIGLSTVHDRPPSLRILDYSYAQRELIWHTLNETLASFLPILTAFQTRTWIRKTFHGKILPFIKQNDQCAVCSNSIVMPHQSTGECYHYFCYYCAFSLIDQSCPICFKNIPNIRPRVFTIK